MRIVELITETAQEDRAILSLSVAVGRRLNSLYGEKQFTRPVTVGKIGNLFDTPLTYANDIILVLQDTEHMLDTAIETGATNRDDTGNFNGIWNPRENVIYLNSDNLGSNLLYTSISHELRHALDTFKSQGRADLPGRYTRPRDKQLQRAVNDPYMSHRYYQSRRDEINARYLEVLHRLTPAIHRFVRAYGSDSFDKIMKYFAKLMQDQGITDVFDTPDRSADYKRLIKRVTEYIKLEMAYALDKQKNNKNENY